MNYEDELFESSNSKFPYRKEVLPGLTQPNPRSTIQGNKPWWQKKESGLEDSLTNSQNEAMVQPNRGQQRESQLNPKSPTNIHYNKGNKNSFTRKVLFFIFYKIRLMIWLAVPQKKI